MIARCLTVALLGASLAACSSDEGNDSNDDDGSTGTDAGTEEEAAAPYDGPPMELIPQAAGACPDFNAGRVTFDLGDGRTRDAEIYIGPEAQSTDASPLLLYWHGTGSLPTFEPPFALEGALDEITAGGGVVAAPYSSSESGIFPWFLTTPSSSPNLEDLELADQIVACAIEKVGIDLKRIYSAGISAGAMHTAQMAGRRSGYLAAVVPISGGGANFPDQDPNNTLAAMNVFGGDSDTAFGFSFKPAVELFDTWMKDRGGFSFLCDHGNGHPPGSLSGPGRAPPEGTGPAIWQFLKDHPYGTDPSPYAGGLPEGFLDYCTL